MPTIPATAKKTTAAAAKAKTGSTITVPQLRVLKTLAKLETGENMDGAHLAKKAKIADTWITGFTFKACAANRTPSLCEQGFVKAIELDIDGKPERRYSITAAGRKALERLDK